jgi:hypothetical protein
MRHWWHYVAAVAMAASLLPTSGCSADMQALAYQFGTGILDALLTAFQSALTASLTATP